ncbi:DUF4360 domain-containing protein [Streptomyces goshikiensis]|uniref:DUF4360 domain-containing protein n=1 Tax=Streptomyces goshikiensis TaxID=1942 RepID=UPI0036D192C4
MLGETASNSRDHASPGPGRAPAARANGSGCKPGTAAVAVAPDSSAFTLPYGEYRARAGGGSWKRCPGR